MTVRVVVVTDVEIDERVIVVEVLLVTVLVADGVWVMLSVEVTMLVLVACSARILDVKVVRMVAQEVGWYSMHLIPCVNCLGEVPSSIRGIIRCGRSLPCTFSGARRPN